MAESKRKSDQLALEQLEGWLANLNGEDFLWDEGPNGYALDTADIRAALRLARSKVAQQP